MVMVMANKLYYLIPLNCVAWCSVFLHASAAVHLLLSGELVWTYFMSGIASFFLKNISAKLWSGE